MSLIVQKYGGSSVADAERIRHVARRIIRNKDGNRIVVVVSAMGKTTDELIGLAGEVSERPDKRELDMLLSTGEVVSSTLLTMALRSMGQRAISLAGAQAGIKTDSTYSRAKITGISTKRIRRELDQGKIVVVAGFQGVNEEYNITTLGRGGSDITAVALAIGLSAVRCEILSDVEGVYSADPRFISEARKLREIFYEEMLEMAALGSRLVHPRAIELGWVYKMPILIASSFNDSPGTLIHGGVSMEVRNKISGISHDSNIAKVTIIGVPDRPGIASAIFEALAKAAISVDTIVQNASVDRITDVTFTVGRPDLESAMEVINPVAESIGARECVSDNRVGKVSIIGSGIQSAPGYASKMFKALSGQDINIEMISTSEIRITCIIEEAKVTEAVRALHKAFKLEAGGV